MKKKRAHNGVAKAAVDRVRDTKGIRQVAIVAITAL
jgi:hypothetical protein